MFKETYDYVFLLFEGVGGVKCQPTRITPEDKFNQSPEDPGDEELPAD